MLNNKNSMLLQMTSYVSVGLSLHIFSKKKWFLMSSLLEEVQGSLPIPEQSPVSPLPSHQCCCDPPSVSPFISWHPKVQLLWAIPFLGLFYSEMLKHSSFLIKIKTDRAWILGSNSLIPYLSRDLQCFTIYSQKAALFGLASSLSNQLKLLGMYI